MKEHFKDFRIAGTIKLTLKYLDEDNRIVKKLWQYPKKDLCAWILKITNEFAADGYRLTLRQLYYQLVGRDIIPNHMAVYKKLGKVKDDMVYGGVLDWSIFEDRGRRPQIAYTEETPLGALQRAYDYYNLDKQNGQPKHLEAWTEKDAISGILKRVTDKYTVPLIVNKGYSGSTAMYVAYRRFLPTLEDCKPVKIFYFGDHDPSGLDMVRDISDRITFMITHGESEIVDDAYAWFTDGGGADFTFYDLEALVAEYDERPTIVPDWVEAYRNLSTWDYTELTDAQEKTFSAAITHLYLNELELFEVLHIGLTQEQIALYDPPPNPAKLTDPRAETYVQQFGNISFEVDALTPQAMTEILTDAVLDEMDDEVYQQVLRQETADKKELLRAIKYAETAPPIADEEE